MFASYIIKIVCDVIKNGEISFISEKQKEMSVEVSQTYRDSNDSLISVSEISWEEAKKNVQRNEVELGRSVEVSRCYKEKMRRIKEEWKTVDDYCKATFLNFPSSTVQVDGKEVKFVDEDAVSPVEGGMKVVENDFPYNFTSGIDHYILWSSQHQPLSTYRHFVESTFPVDKYDVMMFENANKNKSVKSVTHLHVLVRSRPDLSSPLSPPSGFSLLSKI